MLRVILLAALLAVSGPGYAQATRYISDEIPVTLRSGPSIQNRIVRMLPSGTEVKVLQEDEDAGYSQVQSRDGEQSGWVLTRYLMAEASARDRLAAAEKRLQELEGEHRRQQDVIEHLTKQQEDAETAIETLRAEKTALASGIEQTRRDAARGLALLGQFKTLESERNALQKELHGALSDNAVLKDRAQRDWFLAGGGVLFTGILLGLVLPRLRLRRKPRWDTL